MKVEYSMTADEYHAVDAVSASLLKQIQRSPAHAKASLLQQQEPTPAMCFGTAFHTAILEPERFSAEYSVFQGDKRTKEGKASYEALTAAGKTIITQSDMDSIVGMRGAIMSHPAARDILISQYKAEASVFWRDERTGLECKCRPDIWVKNVLADLKTTDDASPEGFSRSIQTYGYGIQAAHYLAGSGADTFIFIAVEKKAPFAVAVYELDPHSLHVCYEKRLGLMEYWADCRTAGMYPAYSDECQLISLPSWAMKGTENV